MIHPIFVFSLCAAGLVMGVPEKEAETIVVAVCEAARARGTSGVLRVGVIGAEDRLQVTLVRAIDATGTEATARIEAESVASAKHAATRLVDGVDPPARAEEPPLAPSPQEPTKEEDVDRAAPRPSARPARHWYGWQTLILDGVAVGLVVAAVASEGDAALAAAGLTYVAGPPIVHFAHRQLIGFGSLGLRTAGPLVTGAAGAALAYLLSGGDDDGGGPHGGWATYGAVLGVGVGILAAPIVDAVLLAYEPAAPTAARPRTGRILPTVVASGRDARIGLAGSF